MPAAAPDARRHVLAISGMIDAAAAAETEAALVARDPAARVAVSLPAGLVRPVWRRRAGAPTETPQGTP